MELSGKLVQQQVLPPPYYVVSLIQVASTSIQSFLWFSQLQLWSGFPSTLISPRVQTDLLHYILLNGVSIFRARFKALFSQSDRIIESYHMWGITISNSKLGSTQHQKICWHWHVARIISSEKIYDLCGLKHHIVERRGGVADVGQPTKHWR